MDFGSHADTVVGVAAAVVDVATPGWRRGRTYEPPTGRALAAALGDAMRDGRRDLPDPRPAQARALARLAAEVRPVFTAVEAGDLDAAVATVNALLRRYRPVPFLDRHDGEPWHLHFHGPRRADPSEWGGGVAVALATVLGSDYADRLGVCGATACDRVFVDVSRNGARRYCSLGCQNRAKAAAHRARSRRA